MWNYILIVIPCFFFVFLLLQSVMLQNPISWLSVLHKWQHGSVMAYPRSVKGRFLWNTSVLKNNGNVPFLQAFQTSNLLARQQDTTVFQDHFEASPNNQVAVFPNLSGDTMLVVPMPVHGHNYVTLRDFIDNASHEQQQSFWKAVADTAIEMMKYGHSLWISTHGTGVDYTHVRISRQPKYYFNDRLSLE